MRRARGCGGRFLNTKNLDNGGTAANDSTKRDSTASSEKTGLALTSIGSLSSESGPFDLFLSKPQATSRDQMQCQLSLHNHSSENRAAEEWDSQDRVIGRGLPHKVWTIKWDYCLVRVFSNDKVYALLMSLILLEERIWSSSNVPSLGAMMPGRVDWAEKIVPVFSEFAEKSFLAGYLLVLAGIAYWSYFYIGINCVFCHVQS